MTDAYNPTPEKDDDAPRLPPLLRPILAPGDPYLAACAAAMLDVQPGAVHWSARKDTLSAALTLAPEAPLGRALAMLFAVANGLGDALGALAPPELGVMFGWPDRVFVNGAAAGRLRFDSDAQSLDAEPSWLVIGVDLRLAPLAGDPGLRPDVTSLSEEGAPHLGRVRLIESWSRHTLVWINRWMDDGPRPLYDAWRARAVGFGETVAFDFAGRRLGGQFLGVDDDHQMLLKTSAGMEAISPLPAMRNPAPAPWED